VLGLRSVELAKVRAGSSPSAYVTGNGDLHGKNISLRDQRALSGGSEMSEGL
jgi:hypothetical protein